MIVQCLQAHDFPNIWLYAWLCNVRFFSWSYMFSNIVRVSHGRTMSISSGSLIQRLLVNLLIAVMNSTYEKNQAPWSDKRGDRSVALSSWLKYGSHHRILGDPCSDISIWLVVWNTFYFCIYWEWSSQLTDNMFQRGRSTTNQQWHIF